MRAAIVAAGVSLAFVTAEAMPLAALASALVALAAVLGHE